MKTVKKSKKIPNEIGVYQFTPKSGARPSIGQLILLPNGSKCFYGIRVYSYFNNSHSSEIVVISDEESMQGEWIQFTPETE